MILDAGSIPEQMMYDTYIICGHVYIIQNPTFAWFVEFNLPSIYYSISFIPAGWFFSVGSELQFYTNVISTPDLHRSLVLRGWGDIFGVLYKLACCMSYPLNHENPQMISSKDIPSPASLCCSLQVRSGAPSSMLALLHPNHGYIFHNPSTYKASQLRIRGTTIIQSFLRVEYPFSIFLYIFCIFVKLNSLKSF